MLKSATVSYNREAGQTKTAAMCDFFGRKEVKWTFLNLPGLNAKSVNK